MEKMKGNAKETETQAKEVEICQEGQGTMLGKILDEETKAEHLTTQDTHCIDSTNTYNPKTYS